MKLLSFVLTLGVAGLAQAGELTAQQIVDKALERNAFGFENALAKITLKLKSQNGNERTRNIEIRSMSVQGLSRTLVRFHSPADVAGTGFLVLEKKDASDEQYLYLPALGKVKRISGSQRHQKFMGTDLTYADLEWESLSKADLKRQADDKVGGTEAYVIEATPKEGSDSQYSRTLTWIHKEAYVPIKVEYFDQAAKLMKTLSVRKLEKKDGKWVATDTAIKDVQVGSETLMTVDELNGKVKFTDADFTERALVGG